MLSGLSKEKLNKKICGLLVICTFICKFSFFGHAASTTINVSVSMLGGILLLMLFRATSCHKFSPYYLLFILALFVLLAFETIMQKEVVIQSVGLATVGLLILLYGIGIPLLYPVENYVRALNVTIAISLALSFLLLWADWGNIFEGGRFSGVFRDSVIMAQVAQLGFVLYFVQLMLRRSMMAFVGSGAACILLYLAGSRSAFLISIGTAILLFVWAYTPKTLFSYTAKQVSLALIVILVVAIAPMAKGVITGDIPFGAREYKTNAIDDRLLHWGYGIQRIEASPLVGQGVLSKYGINGPISIKNFSEQGDPHNLFLYAGQVGGIPLLTLALIGISMLLLATLKELRNGADDKKIIAALIISFIPVFLIGGSMISAGSLLDKILWMNIGYLFLWKKTDSNESGA